MVVFIACDEIFSVDLIGDGNLKRETRRLENFQSLYLESAFEVNIRSGEEFKVKVEADSNILQYINTDVTDGELNISTEPNFQIQPRHPVRFYVRVPSRFSHVEVINGGRVQVDSLFLENLNITLYGVSYFEGERMNTPLKVLAEGSTTFKAEGDFETLNLRQRGSGNVFLSGTCGKSDVILEGSGKIDARDLNMTNADVRVYGSGLILCRVSGTLKALVEGNGRIYYYGFPENIEKKIGDDGMIVPATNN